MRIRPPRPARGNCGKAPRRHASAGSASAGSDAGSGDGVSVCQFHWKSYYRADSGVLLHQSTRLAAYRPSIQLQVPMVEQDRRSRHVADRCPPSTVPDDGRNPQTDDPPGFRGAHDPRRISMFRVNAANSRAGRPASITRHSTGRVDSGRPSNAHSGCLEERIGPLPLPEGVPSPPDWYTSTLRVLNRGWQLYPPPTWIHGGGGRRHELQGVFPFLHTAADGRTATLSGRAGDGLR